MKTKEMNVVPAKKRKVYYLPPSVSIDVKKTDATAKLHIQLTAFAAATAVAAS